MRPWTSDTSATADSRSPRSPTATGSPTAPRSRTTSPRPACGPPSTQGITTFDTADVYANTKAETVLGEALKGERRESPRDLHQGLLADRPGRQERHRPLPQAHHGVDQRLADAGCRPTTSTSTRRTATTPRPRSRRRCRPSPTSSARARRSTSASASGPPTRSAPGTRSRRSSASSSSPASRSTRCCGASSRARSCPTCAELGVSPDRVVPRSPRACSPASTSRVRPRRPGSRATDEKGGADMIKRFMDDDVLTRGAAAAADRRRGRPDDGPARRRLGAPERQRRRGDRRGLAPRAGRPRTSRRRACGSRPRRCRRIDDVLGDVVVRDPAMTAKTAPQTRVA